MDTMQVLKAVVESAEEKKAQDIVVLDIRGLSVMADYFLICHGNSETQVQAIVGAVRDKVIELGLNVNPLEGVEQARWVLLDLGDVVIHVFHKEEREYYNLEKRWADAPRVQLFSEI